MKNLKAKAVMAKNKLGEMPTKVKVSSVFPSGFKKQETKPSQIFSKDILAYKGCFYSLTPNRFLYEIDKTKNENCLILTLFAIAKEIKARVKKNKLWL